MPQFTVTKTTKTYVSVVITYKNGKQVKHTIRDRASFMDATSYLQDNKDIIALLNTCKGLLDANTVQDAKKLYAPAKAQKAKAAESKKARETWYKNNEKQLNKEIEKMVNHPGFLGHGITRQDINATISKDVQKVYGLV